MEVCEAMLEQWFLFCVIWSLCASVDEEGRKKMDGFIREMEGQFPPKVNVCVCVCTHSWGGGGGENAGVKNTDGTQD